MMKKEEQMEREFLEWKERQLLLRKKYSFTPGGFLNPEEEDRARKNLMEAKAAYERRKLYKILSAYESKDEGFVGREEYLRRIDAVIGEDNGVAVLFGVGGIGKTALARAYVRRVQKSAHPFDTVIFLSYNTSMEALICDDSQLSIENLSYSKDKYGSKAGYFREKKKVLCELAKKQRLLLVIDDCNIEKDRRLFEVLSLPCAILVTTRMDPAIWQQEAFEEKENLFSLEKIRVGELETEKEWLDFVQLYQSYSFSEEEKEMLLRYRKKVHGHTLLMLLKIRSLAQSQTDDFSEEPVSDNEEEVAKDLFQRFHLSKNEKQALCELSIMPVQGIEKALYKNLSKVSEETIQRLQNRLLVRQENGWIFIHPLIASAVKKAFSPSQKTYQTMIRQIHALTFHAWNQTYLFNQHLEPYVFALLNACPVPFHWQYREYDAMCTFLWIQGYYEEAQSFCKILFKVVEHHYGKYHQITGEIALRMAAAYYNAVNFKEAGVWYQLAYERLKRCVSFDERYAYVYSTACAKLAREYRYQGRFSDALRLIEKAIEIIGDYDDKGRIDVENQRITACFWQLYKGQILWEMGCLEEAWNLGCESRKNMLELRKETKHGDLSEFDRFLIKMLMKQGAYGKAEKIADAMVERAVIFRQKNSKEMLSAREYLADAWNARGKKTQAQETYEELLDILREEYPYQKKWIERIRGKAKKMPEE